MPLDVSADVIANTPLSSDFNVLVLSAPSIAAKVAPGQFVMVKVLPSHDPLLRRPFSVFQVLRDSGGSPAAISLLNKRIGVSTDLIYRAQPGASVACLGPLGRPFLVVDPPAEAWLVAGGVGLAPFATLAEALRARHVTTTLFYGARRAEELFYLQLFQNLGVRLELTTEDGSAGEQGRVVLPLERRLSRMDPGRPVMMYACGPEGMLEATVKLAITYSRPCEVSVERVMGCGLGGCYSCVVPMRDEHGSCHHVRSCLAGPVLRGDQILWD